MAQVPVVDVAAKFHVGVLVLEVVELDGNEQVCD